MSDVSAARATSSLNSFTDRGTRGGGEAERVKDVWPSVGIVVVFPPMDHTAIQPAISC